MRDSFIFYRSFYEGINELTTEEQAVVVLAILKYQFDEKQPEELTGVSKAIFSLIKPQLDANNKRYENGCKGGAPTKNANAKKKNNRKTTKKQPNENVNVNENDLKENTKEKIHFAEYVSMTNDEYEKLVATHGKVFADQCIEVLDNYKGASGKKYKSDYRAILNWVVDRVKQRGMPFTREKNSEADEKARLLEQAAKEWGMTQ